MRYFMRQLQHLHKENGSGTCKVFLATYFSIDGIIDKVCRGKYSGMKRERLNCESVAALTSAQFLRQGTRLNCHSNAELVHPAALSRIRETTRRKTSPNAV